MSIVKPHVYHQLKATKNRASKLTFHGISLLAYLHAQRMIDLEEQLRTLDPDLPYHRSYGFDQFQIFVLPAMKTPTILTADKITKSHKY